MLTFTLHVASAEDRTAYGVLFESAETVRVTGPGVSSNRHSQHRVVVWDSEDRTRGHGTHVLDVQPAMLADTPVERPPSLGTVAHGDSVLLLYPDGARRRYVVSCRTGRDPLLIDDGSADAVEVVSAGAEPLGDRMVVGGIYDEAAVAARLLGDDHPVAAAVSRAEATFAGLTTDQRLKLLRRVFEALEYNLEGRPGAAWSAGDVCESLGEEFARYGVVFTPPSD